MRIRNRSPRTEHWEMPDSMADKCTFLLLAVTNSEQLFIKVFIHVNTSGLTFKLWSLSNNSLWDTLPKDF